MEDNYKKDLSIDFMNLDVEWANQALFFMHYGELHSKAKSRVDTLYQRRKVKRSEINLEVREDPGKFNLEKATDSAIDSIVRTDEDFKAITKEWLEAVEEMDMLDVAKWAFTHKKEALGGLTQLYVTGYFSSPKLPKDMLDGITEKAREYIEVQQDKALKNSESNPRLSRLKDGNTN